MIRKLKMFFDATWPTLVLIVVMIVLWQVTAAIVENQRSKEVNVASYEYIIDRAKADCPSLKPVLSEMISSGDKLTNAEYNSIRKQCNKEKILLLKESL